MFDLSEYTTIPCDFMRDMKITDESLKELIFNCDEGVKFLSTHPKFG